MSLTPDRMEDLNDIHKTDVAFCYSCLCSKDEQKLSTYTIQTQALLDIFPCKNLELCYVCYRVAQKSEYFLQNALSVCNIIGTLSDFSHLTNGQHKPLIKLDHCQLDSLELPGDDECSDTIHIVVTGTGCKTQKPAESVANDIKVKVEVSEEDGFHDYDADFIGDDNDLETAIKEEDEYPLKLLKEELELEGVKIECFKKERKRKKFKKLEKKKLRKEKIENDKEIKIEMLVLTREQCMEEREAMANDPQYIKSVYQCRDCIKGFSFKSTFDKHMEKHSETIGEFECDICKQRTSSEEKLKSHYRYHTQRFKCLECGLTRISRMIVRDHYLAEHCQEYNLYNCAFCPKSFKRQVLLRKHISNLHKRKERVECPYCHKYYSCIQSMRAHCVKSHPNEVSDVKRLKKHVCQDCGKSFSAPSQLRLHSVKHSHRRDYYCVECNKSFKSDTILKHHLKTAMPHVVYSELPLPCTHCDKRFAIRRDLDRHMNRVHLNIKPYQCDQCERAYINSWSLREHRKLIHEGYKRPLKFPCSMCDKVFDRKQILKSHIRTHTGERPYQCSKCPAQFSQSSVLGTHVKLIHLRLTRDGRPKNQQHTN